MIAVPRPSLKVTWRRERKVFQLLLDGSRQSSSESTRLTQSYEDNNTSTTRGEKQDGKEKYITRAFKACILEGNESEQDGIG